MTPDRPPPDLRVTLPARPESARAVRDRVRRWLTGWAWPEDDLDDVVMAVDEAVANVVDHAYRRPAAAGEVHVRARITAGPAQRQVTVSVTDRGRWRPVPDDPGHRGRGLRVMGACMASLHIGHGTGGGTAVTMTSAPVPAGPDPG